MTRSARTSESKNLVRSARPPESSAPAPVARARRHVYLSVEERVARGKAARQQAPRPSHRKWEQATDRLDPIALLEEQCESRVPELVPIRNGRMLASPFTFFRGAALIMAADLAATPRSGIDVQLCGDAHLSNFGVFGSPERQLVFDINDFDETASRPVGVGREATCRELRDPGSRPRLRRLRPACDRQSGRRGIPERDAARRQAWGRSMPGTTTSTSKRSWTGSTPRPPRDESARRRRGRQKRSREGAGRATARGSSRSGPTRSTGKLRIVADPPLIVPFDDLVDPGMTPDEVKTTDGLVMIQKYRQTLSDHHHPIEEFDYVHSARKIVGVGSVGTRAWIHLFVGRDDQDPLFLQSKEAEASVLERFVGKSEHTEHGRRVVVGQRLMQAASDIFLGWFRVKVTDGRLRHYYVRQLHDWKGGVDLESFRVPGGDALRPAVRSHARPRACTLGRPNRDRDVPGQRQRVRQGDRRLRRRVRRPERT